MSERHIRRQNGEAAQVGKHMAARFAKALGGLRGPAAESVDENAAENHENENAEQRNDADTYVLLQADLFNRSKVKRHVAGSMGWVGGVGGLNLKAHRI